jgi:hypothetical protein
MWGGTIDFSTFQKCELRDVMSEENACDGLRGHATEEKDSNLLVVNKCIRKMSKTSNPSAASLSDAETAGIVLGSLSALATVASLIAYAVKRNT